MSIEEPVEEHDKDGRMLWCCLVHKENRIIT